MNQEIGQESYGLEFIHRLLLKAMVDFDRICRENKLSYALYGGTMLGAERNGKFIPWDDDADVCMTREQFERFQKVVSDEKNSKYYIDATKLWVPRFIYKDEEGTVFVDIFVWDYISEKKLHRFCKIQALRFLQGMMKSNVNYQRYAGSQKIAVFISSWMGKFLSHKFKRNLYLYISEKCFVGKKNYIHCSNEMYKGVAYVFDKEYMSDYIDIQFENQKFMTNRRFREILIKYYGNDYMTPPPVEERKPAHQGYIKRLNQEA